MAQGLGGPAPPREHVPGARQRDAVVGVDGELRHGLAGEEGLLDRAGVRLLGQRADAQRAVAGGAERQQIAGVEVRRLERLVALLRVHRLHAPVRPLDQAVELDAADVEGVRAEGVGPGHNDPEAPEEEAVAVQPPGVGVLALGQSLVVGVGAEGRPAVFVAAVAVPRLQPPAPEVAPFRLARVAEGVGRRRALVPAQQSHPHPLLRGVVSRQELGVLHVLVRVGEGGHLALGGGRGADPHQLPLHGVLPELRVKVRAHPVEHPVQEPGELPGPLVLPVVQALLDVVGLGLHRFALLLPNPGPDFRQHCLAVVGHLQHHILEVCVRVRGLSGQHQGVHQGCLEQVRGGALPRERGHEVRLLQHREEALEDLRPELREEQQAGEVHDRPAALQAAVHGALLLLPARWLQADKLAQDPQDLLRHPQLVQREVDRRAQLQGLDLEVLDVVPVHVHDEVQHGLLLRFLIALRPSGERGRRAAGSKIHRYRQGLHRRLRDHPLGTLQRSVLLIQVALPLGFGLCLLLRRAVGFSVLLGDLLQLEFRPPELHGEDSRAESLPRPCDVLRLLLVVRLLLFVARDHLPILLELQRRLLLLSVPDPGPRPNDVVERLRHRLDHGTVKGLPVHLDGDAGAFAERLGITPQDADAAKYGAESIALGVAALLFPGSADAVGAGLVQDEDRVGRLFSLLLLLALVAPLLVAAAAGALRRRHGLQCGRRRSLRGAG
mmetsp:Transcript_23095/g.56046  ORF Transcript_23095/g.56046 Transcript_23095/m.56046 type:complete len:722 (-) Transcript_23095:2904-5069(-)